MDFTLDETQQSVADLARTVVRAPADHARTVQALASPAGYDETLWKSMAQAGLLSLAVPIGCGGEGFGAVEVAAVLTEVGRSSVALPALATLALGVLPLAAVGGAPVLAEVADGAVLTGTGTPFALSGARLNGHATAVPYAAQAERIVVPVADGLALLDPRADGVQLVRSPTSSGMPEYTLRCDRAAVVEVLPGDPEVVARSLIVGAAAVADGVLAAALELTAAHLRSRHQFGRPLATFQAVAQQVADVYVTARTVHLAACAVSFRQDPDDLDIAAYWLAAELPAALQTLHHLHGGLGLDVTYPLHRYSSRAKDLARLVGGASGRLDRIGARCSSS